MSKKKPAAPVKLAVGQVWERRNGERVTLEWSDSNGGEYASAYDDSCAPVRWWYSDKTKQGRTFRARWCAKAIPQRKYDLVRLISAPKPKPARKGKRK